MALYENKQYLTCECGNDQFTETNIFRVEKVQVSSTLSKTVKHKKEELGNYIQCMTCGKIIKNPIEE